MCRRGVSAVLVLGAVFLAVPRQVTADAPPVGVAVARALLAGQAIFYGAAALGGRTGRLGVLARTFVVLNAAAVVALWRFIRGEQQITW